MSTRTRTKPKPEAELMEWLDKAPENDAAPKEKPKEPPESIWHYLCSACYPLGYTGPGVMKCGKRLAAGTPAQPLRPGRVICPECALIDHQRPLAPCPNGDCPRRSKLGRLWRRLRQ